jgi:hypothetical protein
VEAGVRGRAAILAAVCLALVACDQDPARSVKIIARPAPKEETAATTPATASAPPAAKPASSEKPAAAPVAGERSSGTAGPAATSKKPDTASSPAVIPAAAPPAPIPDFQWRPHLCPPPPEPSPGPSTLVVKGACAFRHQGATKCSSSKDDFYVEMRRPGARDSTMLVYVNVEGYKGPGKYDKAEMLIGVHAPIYVYRWFSDEVQVTVAEDEKSVEIQPLRMEPLPPVEAPDLEVSGTLVCRPGEESAPSGG